LSVFRNFRTTADSNSSLAWKIFPRCSLIVRISTANNSTICLCVSHTDSSADKGKPFADLVAERLQDPAFRKEYESLEEEYSLATEVIALRLEKKLSQKELAELIGSSQPSIARLESGRYSNVSLSFIRRVAKALDAVPELHLRNLR
jgi:DNA-binding Xre family transcriptional regulator